MVPKKATGSGRPQPCDAVAEDRRGTKNNGCEYHSNTPVCITNSFMKRLVTKDVDLAKSWDHRSAWWDEERKIPMEAAIHAKVGAKDGDEVCPFILPCRGYRFNRDLRVMRLGTDFVEGGDFFDLVQSFIIAREMIPLHFAWRFYDAIVEAAIHMHRVHVFHGDLKLENVLVGKEDKEKKEMGGWGIKPLISDFGQALPTNFDGFINPDEFGERGTPRIFAPEQHITFPPLIQLPNGERTHIGEKTTVFQIGVMMHQLVHDLAMPRIPNRKEEMTQDGRLDESVWPYRGDFVSSRDDMTGLRNRTFGREGQNRQRWEDLIRHFKSIHEDIQECLRFHPDDRPTLETLQGKIRAELEVCDGDDPRDDFFDRFNKKNPRSGEEIGHISTLTRAKRPRAEVPEREEDFQTNKRPRTGGSGE
jgi:serine/threonine protein kinase